MSYKDIWDRLYTEINNIPKLNTRTWNYEKTNIDTFPNAIIYPTTWDQQGYDSNSFQTIYNFNVRITEQNKNRQVMEDRIRILIDQVLEKLRKIEQDCSLYKIKTNILFWYEDTEQPKRAVDINISATALNKIN